MKSKLLVFMLLCCGVAMAQNPYMAPLGAVDQQGGVAVSDPRTTLVVDVTVERDVTLCGVYARYAQKYLGVRAPLTDKTTYAIKAASVALFDASSLTAGTPADPSQHVLQHAWSDEEFARLQPDKNSMLTPTLEDAAREAANTIFSLRKHRMELITGEAGENVFGEGLNAALKEIDRQEQSYLELFLGKRVVTTETSRYLVTPQADKKQYVVCRFSPAVGLLSDSDLSGDLVALQIDPSGNTASSVEASPKEQSVMMCRVADPAACTVIAGGREYTKAILPVFEFGRTIRVALPRRK